MYICHFKSTPAAANTSSNHSCDAIKDLRLSVLSGSDGDVEQRGTITARHDFLAVILFHHNGYMALFTP